jgi:D-alanine-D-alanine ligase
MKVAVVFGGESMERDVSVASAAQVVEALRQRGHAVLAIDAERGLLSRDEESSLLVGRISAEPPTRGENAGLLALLETPDLNGVDVVFLAVHGGTGENGCLQALLDLARLPYTGSGRSRTLSTQCWATPSS